MVTVGIFVAQAKIISLHNIMVIGSNIEKYENHCRKKIILVSER